MAKPTSASKKSAGAKKSVLPPPPPPVLLRIHTLGELEVEILAHPGAALVVVVSPLTPPSTDAVIAALEQLNSNRPPALAEAKLAVVYALPSSAEVCRALGVSALPFVRSYAHGDVVAEFAGDNVGKMELLARLAGTAAAEKAAAVAEREKQEAAEAEAAAAAAAAAADGQPAAAEI